MNRRRMMMGGKKPLVIFKQGNANLSAGSFKSDTWNKPYFSGGVLVVSSERAGEGTFHAGGGAVYELDFTGYRKIKYKVNVPNMASYVGGGGFEIGIGVGPFGGNDVYYLSDEWEEGILWESEGDFEGEIDISALNGEWPLNLVANGGTAGGKYAVLNIYELWLE